MNCAGKDETGSSSDRTGKLCDLDDDYNVPDLPVDSPPLMELDDEEEEASQTQGIHTVQYLLNFYFE